MLKLILECKDVRAECEGPVPEQAKKQPLTADRVEKQLRKTGQTPFVLSILRFRWTAISSCQCRQSMNFEEKDFRI